MRDLLSEVLPFVSDSGGPKMCLRVLHMEMVNQNSVEIEFELPTGERTTAVFPLPNSGLSGSEFGQFLKDSGIDYGDMGRLVGETVEVDISKYPEFFDMCEKAPSELTVSVANHPQVVEKDDEYASLEELLYTRLRRIDGVSDEEARRMASDEALDMGDLSALDGRDDADSSSRERLRE